MKKDDSTIEQHFGNPEVLLGFMRRTRKPVFHKSNLFFRDIQFAVRDYFDVIERSPISTPEAERMARKIVEDYTEKGILRKVNNQAYRLEYPEWKTPEDGTYAMLTIHGAPLPQPAESALDEVVHGSPVESVIEEEPEAVELKGGDESPDGNRIAELLLPIAPPKNAEPGHLDGRPFKPGEREYVFHQHRDPQEGTDDTPKPKVEKQIGEAPKIAPPPWMKK